MSAFQFQMPSFGIGRRGRLTDANKPQAGNFGPRPDQDYFQQLAPLVQPQGQPGGQMPTWAQRTQSFGYTPGDQINAGNAIAAAQQINADMRQQARMRPSTAGMGAQQQQMMPTFQGGQMPAYAPQMGGMSRPVAPDQGFRMPVNPMDYSTGRGPTVPLRGPAQAPPTGGALRPGQQQPSVSFGQTRAPSSMYGTSSRSRGYR